jgi:hypothetical protein
MATIIRSKQVVGAAPIALFEVEAVREALADL